MANFDTGRVSYSSLSKGVENDNNKARFHYVDDYTDSPWGSNSSPLHWGITRYESGDDTRNSVQPYNNNNNSMHHPEVNLKNVLNGIFATNGDTFLNSSVYIPSAPPLLEPTGSSGVNYSIYNDVLEAEPPNWLPDSSTTVCMQCTAPFTALTCGRHHCRFCGGVFCRACTKGRCLLPVKFRERDPQGVCDACYYRLDPLQGVLINSISNAVQVAKHDVIDWTCTRGWLNLPLGLSMKHEIYKQGLQYFEKLLPGVARLNPDKSIPLAILKEAKVLAILTVAKAGVLLAYKLGTGLIGGELMDFIIVLHESKDVKTFCSRMHFSLGAGCSAAARPVGRVLEADFRAGDRGSGMCYTYSCSKVVNILKF
ncbi:lateral signaling target protein 2 like protein [Quercus suber]|uniref:Lateral signaling target protein 2 like protein n=1 Tax=Quercus suber TaxID=58331 RepID=A0AAW0IQ53_QUESU